jgi:hypoxanthine-DNA glycosylase
MSEAQHIVHTIAPVYNKRSRVLILGTMPSPQSRAAAFYYGHKQNRFWTVLGAVFNTEVGGSTACKRQFLLEHRIALWDVLAECDIEGASDSSIRNPKPNDFTALFNAAPVKAVLCTGKKSFELYQKLCGSTYPAPFFYLPSPSPANCAMSTAKLCLAYRKILRRFLTDKNSPHN